MIVNSTNSKGQTNFVSSHERVRYIVIVQKIILSFSLYGNSKYRTFTKQLVTME